MGLFDFLIPLKVALENWLVATGLTLPPSSTAFFIIVSIIITGVSGIINRLLLDMDKIAKETEEMQEHQKKKTKAMETADKKLWAQVQKNEDRFMQLQKSTMMTRMLPSLITFGPIIFVFQVLRAAFQHPANIALNGNTACTNSCGVTAILPFHVDSWVPLIGKWFSPYAADATLSVAGFGFWYFLAAIVTSTLIQKLFGINLSGMQNPGMGGTK